MSNIFDNVKFLHEDNNFRKIEKTDKSGNTHYYHVGGPGSAGNRNNATHTYSDGSTSHKASEQDDKRGAKAASMVMPTAKQRDGESREDFNKRTDEEIRTANRHLRHEEKKNKVNEGTIFDNVDMI